MEIPRLAGGPADYPQKNPLEEIELFLDDLLELKKDKELINSHSWLTTFAKNASKLEKELIAFKESKHFSKAMKELLNWIETAEENNKNFSDIIFAAKESHFKKLNELESFMESLIKKDTHGLSNLISILKEAKKI